MTPSAFSNGDDENEDILLSRLRDEAREIVASGDPATHRLLEHTILSPSVTSFEDAVANVAAHRLTVFCPSAFPLAAENEEGALPCSLYVLRLIQTALQSSELEAGHTMKDAIREDAQAIVRRDPACETILEAIMFMKGFCALVCHRAARRLWPNKDADGNAAPPSVQCAKGSAGNRFAALLLQSQAAAAFGIDIHPAATIGSGVVFDHATGVVVGETATIGDGCTILHGVTLGGTAKDGSFDRHPKVGKDVLIGAGSSILGNIKIGHGAKIGSGAVVLRPIPSYATAVGAPAKIIGFAREKRAGSEVDITLTNVEPLVSSKKSSSQESFLSQESSMGSLTSATEATTEDEDEEAVLDDGEDSDAQSDNTAEVSDGDEENDGTSDPIGSTKGEERSEAPVVLPPGCSHWVVPKTHNRDFCPFRALQSSSSCGVPAGAVTRKVLRAILLQEGCEEDEIGEVYFALLRHTSSCSDARKHGYIPPCIFKRYFSEIAAEYTKIAPCRTRAIAQGDSKELKLCRRATIAFKKTFRGLRKATDNYDDRRAKSSLADSMASAAAAVAIEDSGTGDLAESDDGKKLHWADKQ